MCDVVKERVHLFCLFKKVVRRGIKKFILRGRDSASFKGFYVQFRGPKIFRPDDTGP